MKVNKLDGRTPNEPAVLAVDTTNHKANLWFEYTAENEVVLIEEASGKQPRLSKIALMLLRSEYDVEKVIDQNGDLIASFNYGEKYPL